MYNYLIFILLLYIFSFFKKLVESENFSFSLQSIPSKTDTFGTGTKCPS